MLPKRCPEEPIVKKTISAVDTEQESCEDISLSSKGMASSHTDDVSSIEVVHKPVGQLAHLTPPRSKPRILLQPQETRRDAVENTQRLLKTARELFARRGVDAVTMQDIAQAAEVGKGTLYRRFPHKGSLCQALMEDNSQTFQAEVLSWFQTTGRELRPLARLELFLKRLVDFTEANAALLKASFESEIVQGGILFYSSPAYDWKRMTMIVLLRAAVHAGECRPDIDIEYLAEALLAPLQDVNLYLHQRQVLGFTTERISIGLQQLLHGVVCKADDD